MCKETSPQEGSNPTCKLLLRYAVNYVIILEFFPNCGGGLLNSQNFCKLTKCFFVCQMHSEVLKHVLQRVVVVVVISDKFDHLKFI